MGKLHENNFHSDWLELVQYMLAKAVHSNKFALTWTYVTLKDFKNIKQLAKIYLQHTHYAAASQVTSLKGLQIITWNPHLIYVHLDVKEHVACMQKEKKTQIMLHTYI